MRTSKPISTISYNSATFLKMKLNELIESHKISDYMFIEHEPEEDELKKHIHLWIEPNTLIDTMDLQDFFKELDPKNPKNPLGCINFRTSETNHWVLYVEHNPQYLASKGQSREFIYSKSDFVFFDEDTFNHTYNRALKASDFAVNRAQMELIISMSKGELSPYDLFLNSLVPLHKANNIRAVMDMQAKYLERNGGVTHTPKLADKQISS